MLVGIASVKVRSAAAAGPLLADALGVSDVVTGYERLMAWRR